MLLKPGVDLSRLKPEIRRTLNKLISIYYINKETLVITSTYAGDHSPSSLHYANQAIDIRLPTKNPDFVLTAIKNKLGNDFAVILDSDHIHIEYDPD